MQVELTKSQCDNLRYFIEMHFFDEIRNDDDIDNMGWVWDISSAWNTFKKIAEGVDENAN